MSERIVWVLPGSGAWHPLFMLLVLYFHHDKITPDGLTFEGNGVPSWGDWAHRPRPVQS